MIALIEEFSLSTSLPWPVIAVRLLLATILGGVIGFERETFTAGVAFLAAGSILMQHGKVQGLTTGAGMWLAGASGLSAGLGLWPVAILSCLLGGLVLALVRRLEAGVMPKPGEKTSNSGDSG